ncbi:MAG TPA: opioid growth factor receptor-related protein [Pirellulales bacterium]|jgi:hypothetical protein|nr:opioid growth factor receptor-related protein [Pirellulales bacterium]
MSADLIEFYRGDGVDSEGRRLEEILVWEYGRLELVYDFIQWLFPLREPSQFNDQAALLTPEQMNGDRPMLDNRRPTWINCQRSCQGGAEV